MTHDSLSRNLKDIPYLVVECGVVVDIGDALLDLVGYPAESLLQMPVVEVFNRVLRATGNIVDCMNCMQDETDCFIFTKKYEVKEVTISCKHIREENTLIILTEKSNSRMEARLPLVEALLKHNVSGVGVFCVHPYITLLNANQTYLDFFAEPFNAKENSIGKRIDEFIAGWKGSMSEEIWKNIIASGKPYYTEEYAYKWPEKGIRYYKAALIPIFENESLKYVIEITDDITDRVRHRKRIEEQTETLKRKKKQLEAIIENMTDSIFIFDKKGKYIFANKAARKSVETPLKKVGDYYRNVSCFDASGNKLPYTETPEYYVFNRKTVEEMLIHVKKNTKERYISVSGIPILDEKGDLQYGVLCSRDITEKLKHANTVRSWQEQTLKTEKAEKEALAKSLKMKDEFLATITHEFKTPLAVINASVQAINNLYGNQLSDNIKKHIQRIRTNTFRQLRLVNNLLDITRYKTNHIKIRKQNLDIVFLTRVIAQSVMPFAAQKDIKLIFSTDIERREMAIDDEKYERILLNLLSNAIKFTPKGKSIYIHVTCKGKKAILSVRDEGVGIPKNKQSLIFERFGQVDSVLTRQAEGTGIGLSLVKSLVTSMGGTIMLESKVGFGSTFTITLPITKVRGRYAAQNIREQTDSKIMQSVDIEFSDLYIE